MANYKLSNAAKQDLIRIHHFGVDKFGLKQADTYFNSFFDYFEMISNNPYSFQEVDHIRTGYRRCPVGSDTIYFRVNQDIVEIMVIIGKQELHNIF